jgi:hypothetical protein
MFQPRIERANMSRRKTIVITTIAAISIGVLGAGAAVGFVGNLKVIDPDAQTQFAPSEARGQALQFTQVRPALGIPGQPGAGDLAKQIAERLERRPGGLEAANAPVARHRDPSHGHQMTRGGRGQAKNWRGGRPGGEDRDLKLTADEAGTLISAQLIMQGNDRLKIGGVAPQGENTYVVNIVTVDNSLVMQIEIDRNSGRRSIIR